ncbi:MAG TPA: TonB-dependent receptor [Candidatus Angelobacter sp.]|nr:TonB-dependent receptor [Candidatus Angelobacter sp.]
MTKTKRHFQCFMVSLVFGALCLAQSSSRSIHGTVRDQLGAVVGGAKVTAQAEGYRQSVTTLENGEFRFASVPQSAVTITIEAVGFARFERSLSENESQYDAVLAPAALAQQVNVTANRGATSLSDTAESISLLSREDLQNTAAPATDVALRQVPGFTLFRRSDSRTANPTSQGVSLRGIGASGAGRALVLYDGVPLNDPFGGWIYWGRVPRESISSLEVLRGGASSLYGSDAFGGVVNLLPRLPARNLFSSEFSMGMEGTPDFSMTDSLKVGSWNLVNSAEIFRTAGYILVPANQRGIVDTPADSSHQAVQSTVRRSLGRGSLFTSGSFYGEVRNNGTVVQTNDTQLWAISAGVDAPIGPGALQVRGYGDGQSFNQTFSAVAANRNTESLVNAQHVPAQEAGGSLLWTQTLGRWNSLVAGADSGLVRGFSNELTFAGARPSSEVSSGGRQLSSGAFLQDQIHLGSSVGLTLGGRYDNWNNYEAHSRTVPFLPTVKPAFSAFADHTEHAWSPRAALVWAANRHFSFTSSAYKAFRAPTLNELYRGFRLGNTLTLANSQLLAERMSGAESGANMFFGRARFHAAFFWARVSNPIENVTLTTTPALITAQRQNLGRTRSRGVEADAEWRVGKLDLAAGYQFVDATVTSFPANLNLVGLQLPEVAPHQFTARANYRVSNGWMFGLEARASSSQFDDDLNRFSLDPFFQLDGYVSKRLRGGLELFTAVENISNSRVMVAKNPLITQGPPILARVGFRWNIE